MPTGRLNCNYAPMKAHENILVFSKSAACFVRDKTNAMTYNPQFRSGKPYISIKKNIKQAIIMTLNGSVLLQQKMMEAIITLLILLSLN